MRRIWMCLAIALIAVPSHAEPGPVGQWLMNEPVSMWTFGMAQLRQQVYGWNGTNPLAGGLKSVTYDWEENRISIELYFFQEAFDKEKCKQAIERWRALGGIEDGKVMPPSENSTYSENFAPIGYVNKKAPKDYLKRIDEIISVKARFKGGYKAGSCEGRLLSSEILYRDPQ